MYWAMVALTAVMGCSLALQFGGWLWTVNPRLLVVMVAIALLILGTYLTCKTQIIQMKAYLNKLISQLKGQK